MLRLLMLATLALAMCATAAPTGAAAPDPAQPVRISAEDLMSELASGGDKAEAKYKGKQLLIEGTVTEVIPEADVVRLKGTKVTEVACDFPASRKKQVAQCKVGQKVTIRGTFRKTNATGHAEIEQCEVVK